MIAKDFLSPKLFPLKQTDTVEAALDILNESNVAFLPVVEDNRHVGYVCASDIVGIKPKSKKISGYINASVVSKVYEDQHIFEVIRTFSEISSSVISVVDSKDQFVGIIAAKELIDQLATFNAFREPGSIITLEMQKQDYSLAEISRIVEYNNAKVLSLYVHSDEGRSMLQVHLKLNTRDLRSISATFDRYGYNVTASYFAEDDSSGIKDRYDQLMKYLDL